MDGNSSSFAGDPYRVANAVTYETARTDLLELVDLGAIGWQAEPRLINGASAGDWLSKIALPRKTERAGYRPSCLPDGEFVLAPSRRLGTSGTG
jgi:hypothetical protein